MNLFAMVKRHATLLVLVVLLIAIPLTVTLSLQQQNLRKKAAEIEQPGTKQFSVSDYAKIVAEETSATFKGNQLVVESDAERLIHFQKRKEALLQLMEKDPTVASVVALSSAKKSILPGNIQPYVENQETVQGNLVQLHTDSFDDKRSTDQYSLETGSGRVALYFAKKPENLQPGDTISATGLKLDTKMVVKEPADIKTISVAPSNVLAVTSVKKIAVLMVNFQDNTQQPTTESNLRGKIFIDQRINNVLQLSANTYFKEASFNQLRFEGKTRRDGDIFGWYTMPISQTAYANCGPDEFYAWRETVKQVASEHGINLTAYDHVIIALPATPACAAIFPNGVAASEVAGKYSWFINLFSYPGAFAHEMGHLIGAQHANVYDCSRNGQKVSIGNNCKSIEYMDPFDVMGYDIYQRGSGRHMNAYHKAQVGWFAAANTKAITQSGTYTLEMEETLSSNPKILKIARDVDTSLFVELRKPSGQFDNFSTKDPVVNGITIRVGANNYALRLQSQLVDVTTASDVFDSSLKVNESFYDPMSGATIKVLSLGYNNAKVQVTMTPPTCKQNTPTLQILPSSATAISGQVASYTISVTNTDTAGCDPLDLNFRVVPSEPLTTDFANGSTLTVAPSTTGRIDMKIYSQPTDGVGSYPIYVFVNRINGANYATGSTTLQLSEGATPTLSEPSPVSVQTTTAPAPTASSDNLNQFLPKQ